jgi:citrate lyase subunit beta/citryl-CoA lyase
MNQPFAGPALLFCPADRPDRFGKAAAAADVVVLDLEDGVAAADKEAARQNLGEVRLDPTRTVVRINPAGTEEHTRDLAALAGTDYLTVMLAKTENAVDVRRLGENPAGPFQVIALCETALGVLNAVELAGEPATVALMWGAEDLLVSLGGRSSRRPDGGYRDVAVHARGRVLLAAAGYGKAAIDSVFLNFADLEGLRIEAADAAASGFAAKACIHPSQVPAVRESFIPSTDEFIWAARVLRAAKGSAGVFAFEGKMVDEPILALARRLIAATPHPHPLPHPPP